MSYIYQFHVSKLIIYSPGSQMWVESLGCPGTEKTDSEEVNWCSKGRRDLQVPSPHSVLGWCETSQRLMVLSSQGSPSPGSVLPAFKELPAGSQPGITAQRCCAKKTNSETHTHESMLWKLTRVSFPPQSVLRRMCAILLEVGKKKVQ